MKFKYFLRGLGVGVVFSSSVFLAAYQGEGSGNLTEAEIIRRAKDLGMVEKEDQVKALLTSEAGSTEQKKTEGSTKKKKKTTQEATVAETTETVTELTTEETTTETATTEEITTTQATTKAAATTEATTESSQNKTVIIEIVGGMSSYPVCQLLEEAGVIDNADAFDSYLMQNGYAERLVVGQHEVKKGMSDQEIATAITTPNY